jgi:hypothetical protein
MKRIIRKFYILPLSGIILLAGCSKSFIERNPFASVDPSIALGTPDGMQNALSGAYAQLRSVFIFGRDMPVIGDLQADNTFVEARNSGRYLPQYNYSVTVNDAVAGEMWSASYTGILDANRIIAASTTGTTVPAIKAQAYAIRALLYFKLVNIYAKPYTEDPAALGVPLVLTYDPYSLPKRNTVGEVYAQIISDLKTAFQTAPDYTNSVTLSKYAIESILAKVYLYKGDYANAKLAAVDVINNGGFSLVGPDAYYNYWANPGIQSNQVETLFEVDADVVNNNGFDDLGGIYVNGYQDLYVSKGLYTLYSPTDVRTTVLASGSTKSGAAAVLNIKFQNAQSPDRDNLKVMRLSETYLIAAESSLPGNEPDAKMYLNNLMAQRDTAFTGYTSTGATLLNNIVQERRKELAFEGDRLFDLNRLKLPIQRVANAGAIPAGSGNINLLIPYPDNRRVAPIPQAEIQSNANIAGQQNPGY